MKVWGGWILQVGGYVGEPGPQNPLLSSTTMTEPFIIDGFPPSCG